MLKKTWYILISLVLCGFTISIYFLINELKVAFIISTFLSVILLFLGISFWFIQYKKSIHKKLKLVFLLISLSLLVFGILSKYWGWNGSNLEVIFAVLIYCFIYAPLELYLKNAKWSIYSNNKLEMLFLSSLDFVGINLILLGVLSRVMHWPGQYYLIYPGCGLLLIGLVSWNTRFKQEVIRRKNSEDKIKIQYQEIEKEKQISENLLLNILPAEVAQELKAKGSADAKQFDDVTVMFTDFKNFTQISEKLSPAELVAEIDFCFKTFDNIIDKHHIEKIKTIGDSYMCAGGLPVPNKTNAEDIVNAALEIQQFMQAHLIQLKEENKEPFEIRIGIHTGPVVAGIVGVKKFAYDIWGDTVNIASRMETSGEVGKINISGSTYELVKNNFSCIHRGKIEAKNKGMIDMYFVEDRI